MTQFRTQVYKDPVILWHYLQKLQFWYWSGLLFDTSIHIMYWSHAFTYILVQHWPYSWCRGLLWSITHPRSPNLLTYKLCHRLGFEARPWALSVPCQMWVSPHAPRRRRWAPGSNMTIQVWLPHGRALLVLWARRSQYRSSSPHCPSDTKSLIETFAANMDACYLCYR